MADISKLTRHHPVMRRLYKEAPQSLWDMVLKARRAPYIPGLRREVASEFLKWTVKLRYHTKHPALTSLTEALLRKHIDDVADSAGQYTIEHTKEFKRLMAAIFGKSDDEAAKALAKLGIPKGTQAARAVRRAFKAFYNWKGRPPAGTLYRQTKSLFIDALAELRKIKGFAKIADDVLARSRSLLKLVWSATSKKAAQSGAKVFKTGKRVGGKVLLIAGVLWSIYDAAKAKEAVAAIDKEIQSVKDLLKKGKAEDNVEIQRKLYELEAQRKDLQEWGDVAITEVVVPIWPTVIKVMADEEKRRIAVAQEFLDTILEIASTGREDAYGVAAEAIEALRREHWAIRYANVKREAYVVGLHLTGVTIRDVLKHVLAKYGNDVAKWPKSFPDLKDFGLSLAVVVCGFKDKLKDRWAGTKIIFADPNNKYAVYMLKGESSQALLILSTWTTTVADVAAVQSALKRDKDGWVTGVGKISFPKDSLCHTRWALPKDYKWQEIEIRPKGAKEWVWVFELSPYKFGKDAKPVKQIIELYINECKAWNKWLQKQVDDWNSKVRKRLYHILSSEKDWDRMPIHIEFKNFWESK